MPVSLHTKHAEPGSYTADYILVSTGGTEREMTQTLISLLPYFTSVRAKSNFAKIPSFPNNLEDMWDNTCLLTIFRNAQVKDET